MIIRGLLTRNVPEINKKITYSFKFAYDYNKYFDGLKEVGILVNYVKRNK